MKIEIELHEIEKFKREIEELRDKNHKLNEIVKSIDKDAFIRHAEQLAFDYFKIQMTAVCKSLGFEFKTNGYSFHGLLHWSKQTWNGEEELQIDESKYNISAGIMVEEGVKKFILGLYTK